MSVCMQVKGEDKGGEEKRSGGVEEEVMGQ